MTLEMTSGEVPEERSVVQERGERDRKGWWWVEPPILSVLLSQPCNKEREKRW